MSGSISFVFSWRDQVSRSDLPASSKHVALTLALFMSEAGDSCFPAIKTIAGRMSCAESTVKTHLRVLQKAGWIVKTHQGGSERDGKRTSNRYEAAVPNTLPLESNSRSHLTTGSGQHQQPGHLSAPTKSLEHARERPEGLSLSLGPLTSALEAFGEVRLEVSGQPWEPTNRDCNQMARLVDRLGYNAVARIQRACRFLSKTPSEFLSGKAKDVEGLATLFDELEARAAAQGMSTAKPSVIHTADATFVPGSGWIPKE